MRIDKAEQNLWLFDDLEYESTRASPINLFVEQTDDSGWIMGYRILSWSCRSYRITE